MTLLPLYKYKYRYLSNYRTQFSTKYQINVVRTTALLVLQPRNVGWLDQWEELPKGKV